jgi:hypothetical protein
MHSSNLEAVVYVAGSGRSGSTILDMMLGGHSRVLSLGQFDTFSQWLVRPEPCTCGMPLDECPIWSQVVLDARARPGAVIPVGLHQHERRSKLAAGLRSLTGRQGSAPDPDRDMAWALYERTARTSGRRILVDSSKSLMRLVRLRETGDPRLKVIHLVRDPRGFVTSTNTNREYLVDGKIVQGRLSKLEATVNWVVHNTLVHALLRRHFQDRYMVVLYEDLVADPRATLESICGFLGIHFEENMLPPIHPTDYHLIGGNSERRAGYDSLKLDERWRSHLSTSEQWLIRWASAGIYGVLRRDARRERRA